MPSHLQQIGPPQVPAEDEQQRAEAEEQGPFDDHHGALKAWLQGWIEQQTLEKLDPAGNGRMLPGLKPARPFAANAVQGGHFFQGTNENANPRRTQPSASLQDRDRGI